MTVIPNPVPQEWMEAGAPPEALAAFGEGACPVHLVLLRAETITQGGKVGWPLVEIEAGWCETCQAHWHWGEHHGQRMLTATWTPVPA